ncbi:unnamed protein product [Acanthoscelides obtectus]|uniref:Uncharacterized protein n=1 Tax=Acanthoscelides obtectus TaxID=200917 RepID=A0A9P0PHQ7_ACAOB|nr:unnamed protein product [Acanthoscelides obtectus]CAK1650661.1 hypothetical protein AOBTE_LOCUS16853 [Acanthoscelides obtectus]
MVPNSFNFRKSNISLLYDQLFRTNWNFLDSIHDVEEACEQFYAELNVIFSFCVPKYSTTRYRRQFPPWLNGTIIKDIRTKEILFRRLKLNSDEMTLHDYKALRLKIKKDIDIAYKDYVKKLKMI